MGSIMNGIAVHGGTRVFGGTFLTFSDYMRPCRAAGRHHGAAGHLRVDPRLHRPRRGRPDPPADRAPRRAARDPRPRRRPARPTPTRPPPCGRRSSSTPTAPPACCLTRQNVPVFPRGTDGFTRHHQRPPRRLRAARRSTAGCPTSCSSAPAPRSSSPSRRATCWPSDGVRARVVSMPCREWFDEQEASYRETVIPPIVKARVSVEAGIAQGWREVVGDHGRIVSIEHYGARADYARIYREYGITAEAVADAADDSIRAPAADRIASPDRRPREGGTPCPTNPLQAADRRRSVDLARRPVPRAARDRQPRRPREEQLRRRRDDQPVDLRGGAGRRRAVRRAGASSSRPREPTSTAPSSTSPPTTSATPATVLTAELRGHRRRRRPGLDRGRARTWPTTTGRDRDVGRRSSATRSTEPNVLIKIPATTEGCARDHHHDRRRHQRQRDPDLRSGPLPRASWRPTSPGSSRPRDNGHDLSKIHSVASFFVSRVDTEIDKRLEATSARHTTRPAAARPASPTPGWPTASTRSSSPATAGRRSRPPGANKQRPLWASTGVKNPDYRDTMYVDDLVVDDTVNTMPEKTLDAVRRPRRGPAATR